MADIEKIAEDLSNLTVLEAAELAKLLEDKWGVSAAAAPVAMAMPAGGGDAGGAGEEKSEFFKCPNQSSSTTWNNALFNCCSSRV